jgi:hypothetical protein
VVNRVALSGGGFDPGGAHEGNGERREVSGGFESGEQGELEEQ